MLKSRLQQKILIPVIPI